MNAKYIERLDHINYLIKSKSTGSPRELSQKVGLSESKLYEYILLMKNLGAPIRYSKLRRSYYYEFNGEFNFKFIKKD